MEILVHDFDEMEALAKKLINNIKCSEKGATVIGLQGDLGSGKTTFTQLCAKTLGITEPLTSPTFVIIKRYTCTSDCLKTISNFVHIDAYRLSEAHELEVLGFDELKKDSQNLIFLEWPEKVEGTLPDDIINLKFEFVDELTRKVTLPDYVLKED